MKLTHSLSFLLALVCTVPLQAEIYSVASPDGAIRVEIDDAGQKLQYAAFFKDKTIFEKSNVGSFTFANEPDLLGNLGVVEVRRTAHDETWTPVVKSKHAKIRDHYNELTLRVKEKTEKPRQFDLIFRLFDDGLAFKQKLYKNDFVPLREITREATTFRIPGNPTVWVANYKKYASGQEDEFRKKSLDYVDEKTIAGTPFLLKYAEDCWVAIVEAKIKNYPGYYIGTNGEKSHLTTKLSPLPDQKEDGVKVRSEGDIETPWRVALIGANPGVLIESEIIQNLNDPCALADASWIKPGMSAWDNWWSGDIKMTMPVIKTYIDFASTMSWPYMLIDWQWYGKFNSPQANIIKEAKQLNMQEILAYAKSKNVRIILWMHSGDVSRGDAYKKAFPVYAEWGVAGVKIDFMERDDQEMVNWYLDVIKCAAENKLLVDFHGAYKPDGIIRTYPNMITREAVMGNEYYKFTAKMNPDHNVKLAYTRLLAGQMDYTPGGFNNVKRPIRKPPASVGNTRACELAKFVVYESPLTIFCDHPSFVIGQPGSEFVKVVPTTWDDIKFVGGTPESYVAIAKRSGDAWFLGVMNNPQERQVTLDTGKFLPAGKYKVELWVDGPNVKKEFRDIKRTEQVLELGPGKELTLDLGYAGGSVAIFRPE
ncbi:MAG: glycoside hydrolase family 97 protein [Puniceicoccales bacterium]|jgi:alpha-glucosidase|nr:glycoside hydrolase family 97 protein [Puniceicoccales bacterium]